MSDALTQKITALQRCVARVREARGKAGERFHQDLDLQDAAVLNVIRACDTAIDLANMAIRHHRLGVPAESRDSFRILGREGVIDAGLADNLARMVGFRNLAVHRYSELDLNIVEAVINHDLDRLLELAQEIRRALTDPP